MINPTRAFGHGWQTRTRLDPDGRKANPYRPYTQYWHNWLCGYEAAKLVQYQAQFS